MQTELALTEPKAREVEIQSQLYQVLVELDGTTDIEEIHQDLEDAHNSATNYADALKDSSDSKSLNYKVSVVCLTTYYGSEELTSSEEEVVATHNPEDCRDCPDEAYCFNCRDCINNH